MVGTPHAVLYSAHISVFVCICVCVHFTPALLQSRARNPCPPGCHSYPGHMRGFPVANGVKKKKDALCHFNVDGLDKGTPSKTNGNRRRMGL